MYTEIIFDFENLPKKERERLCNENPKPTHMFIHSGNDHLSVQGRGNSCDLAKDNPQLAFHIDSVNEGLPVWLKRIPCNVTLKETIVGHVTNGLYRYGTAKAEVTSFIGIGDFLDQTIETKITIQATGYGAAAHGNTIALYRRIRSGKIRPQDIIEIWPESVEVKTELVPEEVTSAS